MHRQRDLNQALMCGITCKNKRRKLNKVWIDNTVIVAIKRIRAKCSRGSLAKVKVKTRCILMTLLKSNHLPMALTESTSSQAKAICKELIEASNINPSVKSPYIESSASNRQQFWTNVPSRQDLYPAIKAWIIWLRLLEQVSMKWKAHSKRLP